ncbi:MAG: hypothetical protein KAI71_05920 [Candidatus Pacebacteria bacterium]|nr:hypothetical protein [Candidatus Paceibacterota bacterium]
MKPDRILDDNHFELNGFLNGWWVDVDELCDSANWFHSPNWIMELTS